MRVSPFRFAFLGFASTMAVVACGSSAPAVYDYEEATAVVVGDGKGGTAALMPSDCLAIGDVTMADGTCVKPAEKCGATGRADVVVDSNGKVVEVVCYPAIGQDVEHVDGAAVDSVTVGNKGAVILDGTADGADVNGDVVIDGNNSYIFGQGPDVSVIAGNVQVDKNNAGVRGVTIEGNFAVAKNNAALVLSVVEGDVIIDGNNTVIAETTILGNVIIRGNNTQLIGNRVLGNIEIEGNNTVCDGNFAFTDANGDKVAQADEKGAALTCAPKP